MERKHFSFSGDRNPPYEIIGVVENARYVNPREAVDPMFFLPYLQMVPSEWTNSVRARSNFVQDMELRIDPSAQDLDGQLRRTLQDGMRIST